MLTLTLEGVTDWEIGPAKIAKEFRAGGTMRRAEAQKRARPSLILAQLLLVRADYGQAGS